MTRYDEIISVADPEVVTKGLGDTTSHSRPLSKLAGLVSGADPGLLVGWGANPWRGIQPFLFNTLSG